MVTLSFLGLVLRVVADLEGATLTGSKGLEKQMLEIATAAK